MNNATTLAKRRLDGIESLRAYAAVSIILFHLIGVGSVPVPDSLGFIASHFGQGVPLFFVVSGFSLAYGYANRLRDEQAIATYFRRRLFRIAPLFYAALIFQLFFLWLRYDRTFSVQEVFLNATFVFNLLPNLTDGIVSASWTIGVEMLFYAMFPALLMFCTSFARTAAAILLATTVAARFGMDTNGIADQVPSFVNHNFLKNLPLFLWGIAFYHAYVLVAARVHDANRRYSGWVISVAAILAILLLYHGHSFYAWFSSRDMRFAWETFWGVPFGLLCLGMAIHPSRILSNRVTRYLGMISFSLYIVHANILYETGQAGVYEWIRGIVSGHEGAAYVLSALLSLAMITVVASATYKWIEVPGMNWGKRHKAQPAVPSSLDAKREPAN